MEGQEWLVFVHNQAVLVKFLRSYPEGKIRTDAVIYQSKVGIFARARGLGVMTSP